MHPLRLTRCATCWQDNKQIHTLACLPKDDGGKARPCCSVMCRIHPRTGMGITENRLARTHSPFFFREGRTQREQSHKGPQGQKAPATSGRMLTTRNYHASSQSPSTARATMPTGTPNTWPDHWPSSAAKESQKTTYASRPRRKAGAQAISAEKCPKPFQERQNRPERPKPPRTP